jgi:two-component system, chemotaxis family, chemotaxis protein CheY
MTALEDAYKTLKVLVIDDQEAFRITIGVMLEHLGVGEIFQAADGAGGFAELIRARPDIVLCDMHMRPIDGQEFLRLVREAESEWVRGVPVLFLSGDNHLDTIRGAAQQHSDGYLVKPFLVHDLKQQLDITIARLAERGRLKAL